VREQTLARQKDVGVVPQDAVLTARPEEIPAWDDLPADLKSVLARQMEVYAGFLEHTDHHVGRLVDALAELEILDDTLIYVIIGDNGASALETPELMTARIDKFGTSEAYNHYAVRWAHAMDTPYQWTKQVASHWGGTRQRDHRALGRRHRSPQRDPAPVPPRHRRRANRPGRGRFARAGNRSRGAAASAGGCEHGLQLRQHNRSGQDRRDTADDVLRQRDHRRRRRQRDTGQRRLRPKGSAFTGRVRWVQIDLGDAADDHDHLITPEERYRVAMTRQ
jgi:hypothetical protein